MTVPTMDAMGDVTVDDALARVFVRVNPLVSDVSPYVLAIAARAGIAEDVAVEAARVANDKRYSVTAAGDREARVLGKLASWRVKRIKGRKVYVLRWPSGFEAVWRPSDAFLSRPLSERVARLTDVVYVETEERGGVHEVRRIKFLRTRADHDAFARFAAAAARAARDEELTGLGNAVALFFVKSDAGHGTRLQLALRFALLSVRGSAHFAEWSVKSVLKSTMFALFEDYDNYWHITGERPSLATLIGDARTGITRLAGVDGVAFDEIGSWRRSRAADDEGWWAAIRTGLANCRWKRAKGGAKAIAVERCVATYWAGNPSEKPLDGKIPPFEYHRLWLRNQGIDGEELEAMGSRFAGSWGVDDVAVSDDTMRNLRTSVVAPGVFRAAAETIRAIVARHEPPPPACELSSRQHVYWRSVYPAVRAIVANKGDAMRIACGLIRGVLLVNIDGYEVM